MACIWECDNCGAVSRAHVWTCDEGWHRPPGWLEGRGMELVCGEDCAFELGKNQMTPTRRPRLQVVQDPTSDLSGER